MDHNDNPEDEVRSRGSSVGSSSVGSDIDVVFGGVDEESHETEAELLIEQISSVIDQLFSLTLQIRNPANRQPPAVERIDLYQHVSPVIKNQYIKTREDMEYHGLMQVFQQCRREAKREDDNDDGTYSELDDLDKALIRRFLKANHIRRCYFHYWKRHKIKSSRFASVITEPEDERLPAPSMPRTAITRQPGALSVRPSEVSHPLSSRLASTIPLPADFVLNETIAPSSHSSRGPMVIEKDSDGLVVHWPTPPGHYYSTEKTKDFECPYCFFFCSSRTAKVEAWKYDNVFPCLEKR
ncbi:hypothetical protein SLS60_008535 [Paraconiothyrium brasiliense]|uniref:Uncharacterized protein n=1 Tax=Paraconiothyrium brasiliense TaxID=300254 RepID=A0ABR3R250_9PLEO